MTHLLLHKTPNLVSSEPGAAQLPETQRPKLWSALISKALDSVTPKWAAFFPGPLDGFLPVGVSSQRKADVKKVKSLLKRRSSFKQAPGLTVIAYGGGIDASLTKEILRLLEGSGQQLSKLSTAHEILRCCAYIAATTKDTQLAGAVINRCLRLVAPETSANSILALMLVAIQACAAHGNSMTYYTECGTVASRFAYATSSSAALDARATLEALGHRDPKFIAALGQAMAVLEATVMGR